VKSGISVVVGSHARQYPHHREIGWRPFYRGERGTVIAVSVLAKLDRLQKVS